MTPAQAPSPDPAAKRTAETGPSKAEQAFQRGLTALTQWVEREVAGRTVPRGHIEEIPVDGETEPVTVKLGVWISNTRARRHKLTAEQLAALRGPAWTGHEDTVVVLTLAMKRPVRGAPDRPLHVRRSQTSPAR
ncbi:helicase associated domain-containing protein [Streptomyces sp. NBC_00989]|uniref:helicase associated domain-containing protein n=1 Tax=Streptomyces sp. NBC_00989 TaxID=2903705 RepID=UPI0038680A92